MSNSYLTTNETIAVKPVAPYIGGKMLLAKTIIPIIETIPHKTYAEPFVGMGGIFFRRTKMAKSEFINDKNREITNLFRILQRHYPQFMDMIKYQLTSRADFKRLKKTDHETLTDLERAARFLYLQRTVFGGMVEGNTFGTAVERPARYDLLKLLPMLEDVHERLSRVTIECLNYDEFIKRYDKPNTLFYLDPPYYNCEDYYGKNLFERADFEKIAYLLGSIKGKFILSLNDLPEVREIFKGFHFKQVQTTYTANTKKVKEKVFEVLISNVEM